MRPSVRKCVRVVVLFLGLLVPAAAGAQPPPVPGCEIPVQIEGGSFALICVPPPGLWNGQLVVFAHGYVAPDDPLGLGFQLPSLNGVPLPDVVQSLGYAFATTTYRRNGLAILEGVDDVLALVEAFKADHPPPTRTHLVGVSEGGLVATLLAERWSESFTSAFAACAPIGAFRLQLNYISDFRVLFDYFFPGVIPGSAIDIPPAVIANWDTYFVPYIKALLALNPARALELMRVSHAAYDPSNPLTVGEATLNILRYNITGTNDARQHLGGNPYGNRLTWYFGSSNDLRLNLLVRRFSASPVALEALRAYETNGNLRIPLVTLHTTADDLVPFAHELLYLPKVDLTDRGRFVPLPVNRYGHCNFTTNELLGSFLLAASLP